MRKLKDISGSIHQTRISSSFVRLILDVTRQTLEELKEYESVVRTAELYVIAYLYEHREEADHKTMTETLKYLFFGIRREMF